jgi:hypothetical protein
MLRSRDNRPGEPYAAPFEMSQLGQFRQMREQILAPPFAPVVMGTR